MYEDLPFDADLMAQLEALQPTVTAGAGNRINFYVPTLKQFETSEVSSCGKNDFPASRSPAAIAICNATTAKPRFSPR